MTCCRQTLRWRVIRGELCTNSEESGHGQLNSSVGLHIKQPWPSQGTTKLVILEMILWVDENGTLQVS